MFVVKKRISLIPGPLNMSRDKYLMQLSEICQERWGMGERLAYAMVLSAMAEMVEYEYDI